MDRTLSYVKDLSCAKDMWNMKVRIIKKWKQSFRLDMIFIDEQGQNIQACVRSDLISEFEDLLKEDGVYILRKFGVGQQKDQYPVTTNEVKINFFRCTEVTPAEGWTGHPYGFAFWKFTDILEKKAATARTVDVMGKLAWCGNLDIFKTKNKESKRINFELQDYGSNVLKCTMWDDYAVQFNNYIVDHKSTEMIIVIIQHAKIKEWNGNLTVQNDMFGTRVFINEDLDEANVFRRGLILRDGASASQSQLSSQTVYPLRREFLVETESKTVDSIIETTKDSYFIVLGTIKIVEDQAGWFYVACRKCNKKVMTKSEYLQKATEIDDKFLEAEPSSLWCSTCKGMATSMVPKFRVQMRVQDATGSVSFLMFDKEVNKILGISASDIRDRQLKSNDMLAFPHELDALVNKMYAFKIHVAKYNIDNKHYVYTVSKFTDDPDIIGELVEAERVEAPNGVVQEDPEQAGEGCSFKLSESSQCGFDSKDVASVTGDSLAGNAEKDDAISPLGKRSAAVVPVDVQASSTKRIKKKLLPYNV